MKSSDSEKREYRCSIYEKRPLACINYPWNVANSIFSNCIFVDTGSEKLRIRSMEEQLKMNTQKEISDYCISCGMCCFYESTACSQLIITEEKNDKRK